MARYGMLINTKKCIGCYACRTACQRQNGLDPADSFIRFEEQRGRRVSERERRARAAAVHALRGRAVLQRLPDRRRPHRPRRHRRGRPGPLHRLPVLHGRLPLPGAQPQREDRRRRQVPLLQRVQLHERHRDVQLRDGLPTGARIFGDLDDPDCELVKEIAATHAAPIAGDLTKSKVYYVR